MTTDAARLSEGDCLAADRLVESLDAVRDFRGDVTLVLKDGRTIEGFVFDVKLGTDLDSCELRLLSPGASTRVRVAGREIDTVRITGKDTAAGKNWDAWVRRYAQKRQAGEAASIECESIE